MHPGLEPLHETVAAWFHDRFAAPSPPQEQGWPQIRNGKHVLIAAPTGSGKTLAAFLCALDGLLRQGQDLADRLQVLYVSPLKALSNDVQKNLQSPLRELRERDASLPDVRVQVRTGDTPARERQAMLRRPPHILVTTPESLYLLLTTVRGREQLRSVRTVIVDEIHALARDKRGSHLSLTLERLDRLVTQDGGDLQRIGLSATQRPIEDTAALLCGSPLAGRSCAIIDGGHRRELDLRVEVPSAPLGVICSEDTWTAVYRRMAELIGQHRTTLVFVNTRKMAERIAARLAKELGEDQVTSHHGSLSRQRRLDAEQRLKQGKLKALVATASLELGIDVGDVDLVIQVGPTSSIAGLLQRVGRAGHGIGRLPIGRLFPLTRDELVTAAATMHAIGQGVLDRTVQPSAPLDILAQQIVAICVDETIDEDELLTLCQRSHAFADLEREQFDQVVRMHTGSRRALLHRDPIHHRLRATRRARLVAVTCGGAIPDNADYRVVLDEDDTPIGSVHEDFAIEASVGDVFQLGNQSWQIRRVAAGTVRVRDAQGAPPSLPFWIGEAPSRSRELSDAISDVRTHGSDREWLRDNCGLIDAASEQLSEYIRSGSESLGATPTRDCLVLERFFDDSGGQQLVLHSPFGSRINRAFGLALRKKFCTGFGYELQAAANEEALVISLGPMHSFPLDDVWKFLHPASARDVLEQALLPAPMFQTRWRWNVSRSLLVERFQSGRRTPAPLLRFRADDALAAAFPAAQACPETLPGGPLEIPRGHPLVDQTIEDCLREAMDVDGFLELLGRIRDGSIRLHAIDTTTPSPFAEGILNAMPYAFLDDAPLEERRTQAVTRAQRGSRVIQNEDGALDPDAVAQVGREAWPDPRNAEELHEALGWMGLLEQAEVADHWHAWLEQLLADGRAQHVDGRIVAADSSDEAVDRWRGRLEAKVPIFFEALDAPEQQALLQLEASGTAMRAQLLDQVAFFDRRLLARIRRYMIERLRSAIRPVSLARYREFERGWLGLTGEPRRHGPQGLRNTLHQLATVARPITEWEQEILAPRVEGYERGMLDQLTLGGEFVWLRLWGSWRGPLSRAPLSIVPRLELNHWLQLAAKPPDEEGLSAAGKTVLGFLRERGASFPTDLQSWAGLLPSQLEDALAELIGRGWVTCDSIAAARQLAIPPSRRRFPLAGIGRFSLIPWPAADRPSEQALQVCARALLARFGVMAHQLLLDERFAVPWRLLLRTLRSMELSGEVRGGRFVTAWAGEQFADPAAIGPLRRTADRTQPEQEATSASLSGDADSTVA